MEAAARPSGVVTIGRALPTVLLVVVTGAVVAVSTGGVHVLARAADMSSAWAWTVRIAGAAVAVAGATWLLAERRRIRAAVPRGPDPALVALRTAGTIMGAVAALALLNPPAPLPVDDGYRRPGVPEGRPFGSDAPGGEGLEGGARGSDPIIQGDMPQGEIPVEEFELNFVDPAQQSLMRRMVGFLPRILLFALIVASVWHVARRMGPTAEDGAAHTPLEPEHAEAGLEASLLAISGDSRDPAWQITHAYHRLLVALAEAGAPREPHEAPHEHLNRALGPLGVRAEPLHRLTGLYVLAQFGGRPVTERHRAAAADALEVSLADLRAYRASHPAPDLSLGSAGA